MAIRLIPALLVATGALVTMCGGALALVGWKAQHDAEIVWEQAPTEVQSTYASADRKFQLRERISFPSLDRRYIVFQGATFQNLLMGPSRVAGSGVPGDGNLVIAAHRDTHFRILKDVRRGDPIIVDDGDREFRYRVESMQVVNPADDSFYQPTDTPVLTLVTCYPFYYLGAAPERYIVRAALTSLAL